VIIADFATKEVCNHGTGDASNQRLLDRM